MGHEEATTGGTPPVALVTGVGRTVGIGAAVAVRLAADGWDVATTPWAPYDDRLPWQRQHDGPEPVAAAVRNRGARVLTVPADLEDPTAPAVVLDAVEAGLVGCWSVSTPPASAASPGAAGWSR